MPLCLAFGPCRLRCFLVLRQIREASDVRLGELELAQSGQKLTLGVGPFRHAQHRRIRTVGDVGGAHTGGKRRTAYDNGRVFRYAYLELSGMGRTLHDPGAYGAALARVDELVRDNDRAVGLSDGHDRDGRGAFAAGKLQIRENPIAILDGGTGTENR